MQARVGELEARLSAYEQQQQQSAPQQQQSSQLSQHQMHDPEEEEEEEEEGLQGVFKRLRGNGHHGWPARKRTANGSARAVTQVRPNPGKMVSVCKYRHMAMQAQPPSSLHAIRPHNLHDPESMHEGSLLTGHEVKVPVAATPGTDSADNVGAAATAALSGGPLNTWRSGDDGRAMTARSLVRF
jgi:hypothetical protein